MGLVALGVGAGLIGGGAYLGGKDKSGRRREITDALDDYLPNIPLSQSQWFSDMGRYFQPSLELSNKIDNSQFEKALAMRERVLPGFGAAQADAMRFIAPLMRGQLPPEAIAAASRGAGADVVGRGFGGARDYNALIHGIYQGKGSLGAAGTGMSLLTSLMGTMPNIQTTSPLSFLSQLMTPQQRVQTQLNIRQQNLGLVGQRAGMETSGGVMGGAMGQIGGLLMGGAMGGIGGGAGGGGAGGFGGGWSVPLGNTVIPTYGGLWGNTFNGGGFNPAQQANWDAATGMQANRLRLP